MSYAWFTTDARLLELDLISPILSEQFSKKRGKAKRHLHLSYCVSPVLLTGCTIFSSILHFIKSQLQAQCLLICNCPPKCLKTGSFFPLEASFRFDGHDSLRYLIPQICALLPAPGPVCPFITSRARTVQYSTVHSAVIRSPSHSELSKCHIEIPQTHSSQDRCPLDYTSLTSIYNDTYLGDRRR